MKQRIECSWGHSGMGTAKTSFQSEKREPKTLDTFTLE